jgi:hypothetical protein
MDSQQGTNEFKIYPSKDLTYGCSLTDELYQENFLMSPFNLYSGRES